MKSSQCNYGFSGYDTETISGYARIAATQNRAWLVDSFESAIRPLINDVNNKKMSARIFLYNMDYDVRAILKYLTEDQIRSIGEEDNVIIDERYKISYIPSKLFRVRDVVSKKTITFYDMAQFMEFMHLDDVAKKYLNKEKMSTEVTETFKNMQSEWTDEQLEKYMMDNLDELKEYCMIDATLSMGIGVFVDQKIFELFNVHLKSFTSKASVSQKLTLDWCGGSKGYPIFWRKSHEGKYAESAYRGGIFDCSQRGSFDQVMNVDISSAYPDVMIDLPHWANGDFIKVDPKDVRDSDYYGWFMCEFDCHYIPYPTSQINQIVERVGDDEKIITFPNKSIIYPTGKRTQIITLLEYRFMKHYGYDAELLKGYVWRVNYTHKQRDNPFGWIQEVYNKKCEIKESLGTDSYEYDLTKKAMNGGYGKTCQKIGFGVLRNFFYASYITAQCRVKINSFIIDHNLQDRHILTATDGILFKDWDDLGDLGRGLGSWDVDYYDGAFVLGNGVYQLEKFNKDYEVKKLAARGFPVSKDTNYRKIAKDNPDVDKIYLPGKSRPLTIKKCLIYKKYGVSDINVFESYTKQISCVSDKSKVWEGINTFSDLSNGTFKGIRYELIDGKKPDIKIDRLCPKCGRIIENDKKKYCNRCMKHRRHVVWDKIRNIFN